MSVTKRDEALQLLEDGMSAADVARQLGVPAATIRVWRHRAGASGPPAGADPQTWAVAKDAGAREAWQVAQDALARVRQLLNAGKTGDAKNAALTFAILTDKSGVMENAVHAAQMRQVQLAQAQSEVLAGVLDALLAALDADSQPARQLVRSLLGQASRGEPIAAQPEDAESARSVIRERVAVEIRESLETELAAQAVEREQRQLPAPADPHPDGRDADERSEMSAPVRRVRASRERRRKRERVEVVTGEVVDEGKGSWRPTGRGQGAVDQGARRGRDVLRIDPDGNPINPERGRAPWDE